MLEFSISNQLLSRLEATQVVSGSQNYLECRFQFSEDWDGLKKVAVFGHSTVENPIGVELEEDVCRVPHEVIEPYGFQVTVLGSGGVDGEYTHVPTNVVTVEVVASGEDSGLEAEPTQSLYDSVMGKLQQVQETTDKAKVASQASSLQAQAACTKAQEAQLQAEQVQTLASQRADAATGAAKAAEKSKAAILEVQTSMEQQRDNLETAQRKTEKLAEAVNEAKVLTQGYAKGSWDSGETVLEAETLDFSAGAVRELAGELVAGRRYLVEADGQVYDGVARLVEEEGSLDIGSLTAEETQDGTGEATDGEEVEIPEEDGGEVERPDVIGKRVVKLEAGGLTLVYTCLQPAIEEEGTDYDTLVISGTGTVSGFALRKDGEDNARYYMEQAKEQSEEAYRNRRLAWSYVSMTNSYKEEAYDYAVEAESHAQAAAKAAQQAKDISGGDFLTRREVLEKLEEYLALAKAYTDEKTAAQA